MSGPGHAATTDDVMTIAAARELADGVVCFVGIGLPSLAANLARRLQAPRAVLIYESGTIGAKPTRPPLSIGDGELADTADVVVSVAEIFAYWLQAGRIDVGFLGAAQVDRFGNINTTVVGDYGRPAVRLPGAGGAPEIAAHARQTLIVLRQDRRSFVEHLDFRTSVGQGDGLGSRPALGMRGAGPTAVITDLGILRPDPTDGQLVLTAVHPGRTIEEAREATGWPLRVAASVATTSPPSADELSALRDLREAR